MPNPEDTVTNSPDSPSAAAPEKRARFDEAPSEKQTPHASGEWEEPHPGQRYSITVLGNARPGAAHSNGVGKVGMAAKPYSPYPGRGLPSGGTRRFAPARLRTPSTRLTKDPVAARVSLHKTPSATAILGRPIPPTPATSTAGQNTANSLHPHAAAAADPVSMDLSTSDAASIRLSMMDLSGFLRPGLTAITTSSTDASSYVMGLDSEKLTRLTPNDAEKDPYGWEAALGDRPVGTSCSADDDEDAECTGGVGDFCPVLQFRRAGGAKKTLLRRVLSLGPARE